MAIGDGRNDIDMLEWAAAEGRAVAMGQAPDEVRAAANELTATDLDDGVARVLDPSDRSGWPAAPTWLIRNSQPASLHSAFGRTLTGGPPHAQDHPPARPLRATVA